MDREPKHVPLPFQFRVVRGYCREQTSAVDKFAREEFISFSYYTETRSYSAGEA